MREGEIEQSKDRLRIKLLTTGLETSSNLVIIIDAKSSIWWVNDAFLRLSGFSLEEVIGKHSRMILSERNEPEVLLQIKDSFVRQLEWRGEIVACGRDGRDFVDEVSLTPILDDKGSASYFLIVGQDVTEKAQAREAILKAREAQIKAERVFSIGTMAAGISHEINQPLNSIKVISGGILYLLNQGETLQAEEFVESMKQISSQADRISNIIKHLRSFMQTSILPSQPCVPESMIIWKSRLTWKNWRQSLNGLPSTRRFCVKIKT